MSSIALKWKFPAINTYIRRKQLYKQLNVKPHRSRKTRTELKIKKSSNKDQGIKQHTMNQELYNVTVYSSIVLNQGPEGKQ